MEKLGIALYKQFISGKYCDLSIQVENTTFQAHSCVIAAASWVLEAILQSSKTGEASIQTNSSIQLHGVTAHAMSALLSYIYTGKLNPEVFVDDEKQREILHAAKLYKLDDIAEQLAPGSIPVTVPKPVDEGAMGHFQMPLLESGQLSENIFEIPGEIPEKTDGSMTELTNASGPEQISVTILNTDPMMPMDDSDTSLSEKKLPLKEAQDHVSQSFKFSKEHGILYCILCCEICDSPNELINHMAEHKNETRRRSSSSRPERAAAVAANAAASLALTNDIHDTNDLVEIETPKKRKRAIPKKSFACAECAITYTTKVYLIRHYSLRHPASFYCKFCADYFESKDQLDSHLLIHEDEAEGKVPVKIDYHKKGAGRGKKMKKVFACNLCATSFGKKRDLNHHQQIQHGIVKPMHVCTVCGKEFKEKASLRAHTRVHTGEKPYMCSYCGNSFADQKTWKDHERRHRGEKPFLCTTCGKSFTYRQSFTRHMKFHEGKRPFQCSFCGKAFVLRQNLKEHEKRHTK